MAPTMLMAIDRAREYATGAPISTQVAPPSGRARVIAPIAFEPEIAAVDDDQRAARMASFPGAVSGAMAAATRISNMGTRS